MRTEVLGLPVDMISRTETMDVLGKWILKKDYPKMVVTSYSEFFVAANKDKDFRDVVKKADLVVPDGVSVLAAAGYLQRTKKLKNLKNQNSVLRKIGEGLKAGGEILSGKVGEPVTGVWLFDELTKQAAKKGWKVFLLGGWDNVSGRAAEKLLRDYPNIRVEFDEGEKLVGTDPETDKRVTKKINAFNPDLLFVAYNPVKQEKWIYSHLKELKSGIAIGVGGTFNEFLGEFAKAPAWMEKMGFKWLWRVLVEPRRISRIFKAVLVFPWLVFKESLD